MRLRRIQQFQSASNHHSLGLGYLALCAPSGGAEQYHFPTSQIPTQATRDETKISMRYLLTSIILNTAWRYVHWRVSLFLKTTHTCQWMSSSLKASFTHRMQPMQLRAQSVFITHRLLRLALHNWHSTQIQYPCPTSSQPAAVKASAWEAWGIGGESVGRMGAITK